MPGLTLVFAKGAPVANPSRVAHVALTVTPAELDACRSLLSRLGLQFEEPRHGPPGRALYFLDPDENLFELSTIEPPGDGDA